MPLKHIEPALGLSACAAQSELRIRARPEVPEVRLFGFTREQDCPSCDGRAEQEYTARRILAQLRIRLEESPTARIFVTADPLQEIRVEIDTIRECSSGCANCGDEDTAPNSWIQVQPGAYREINLCNLCVGHALEILRPEAILPMESLLEQLLDTAVERERTWRAADRRGATSDPTETDLEDLPW
jgi:hypothetical protein